MAMGKRKKQRQEPLWVAASDLPTSPGHPFYQRLNQVLEAQGFDAFVEGLCSSFYAAGVGRPGLPPGRYFRLMLLGYFEGLGSERGMVGARRTRWPSGASWVWPWTRGRPITRRFRGPGG